MIKPITIIGFLSLAVVLNANAHDSDEFDKLEQEMQEIKHRVSELEAKSKTPSNTSKPATSSNGWKSISNWRKLSTGMNEDEVSQLLGEPLRISGGTLATWYYENRGDVRFFNGEVSQWNEPRK